MNSSSETSTSSKSGSRELVGAEVLVIDKDPRVQKGIAQLLSAAKLHVTCVESPEAGLRKLESRFFAVVIVDLDTPYPNAGLETTTQVNAASPTSMVVMMTPRKSFEDSVASIRAGAIDIILKTPGSVTYLRERVLDAAGRSVDRREVAAVLAEVKATQDEFLERFVDAEKRNVDLRDQIAGRTADDLVEGVRVLTVAPSEDVAKQLGERTTNRFAFEAATTGGQGLDRASSSGYHIVMVFDGLSDLPVSMVSRSIKTQNPDMVVIEVNNPGPGAKVQLLSSSGKAPIVENFTGGDQLLEQLKLLSEEFNQKAQNRRYNQAFRERHYNFLRRYVEIKIKIDRALSS